VRTASTPSEASASQASIAVTRPLGIRAPTIIACVSPGSTISPL
jgi:hypothetical protein